MLGYYLVILLGIGLFTAGAIALAQYRHPERYDTRSPQRKD